MPILCLTNHLLLNLRSRHMFFTKEDQREEIENNVDRYMDSYARDTTVVELKEVGGCHLLSIERTPY